MAARSAIRGASSGASPPIGASAKMLSAAGSRRADRDIRSIVGTIYQGLSPALQGAAALSVFAHLEDLVERGLIVTDGPARLEGVYAPA